MSEKTLPSDWKNCATCVYWCGRQKPNVFNNLVTFDSNEKARCAGGGFNNSQMPALGTCPKWQQRFRK